MSFEESLIEHCAPTLAGMKPASLFRIFSQDAYLFAMQFKRWRTWVAQFGLQLIVLKGCRADGSYLLYLYRQRQLDHILSDPTIRSYLTQLDYSPSQDLLRQLAKRLCLKRDFPHEIGIFLGYPLEDVLGFIQNHGEKYTYCGYWKVYGDAQAAQERFARYHACTMCYKQRFAQGTPVTQLIVAA